MRKTSCRENKCPPTFLFSHCICTDYTKPGAQSWDPGDAVDRGQFLTRWLRDEKKPAHSLTEEFTPQGKTHKVFKTEKGTDSHLVNISNSVGPMVSDS